MGASRKQTKDSQRGRRKNSVVMRVVESVMKRAGSRKPHYVIKLPLNKRIGRVFYTVQSPIQEVTFTKRKYAERFKELLEESTEAYQSDIVRREVTEEGYELTNNGEGK